MRRVAKFGQQDLLSTVVGLIGVVGGTAALASHVSNVHKDVEKERELRDKDTAKERELRDKDIAKESEMRAKDIAHERELRMAHESEQRRLTDLVTKANMFNVLHHSDFEEAARLLKSSQTGAAPPPPPSTDRPDTD